MRFVIYWLITCIVFTVFFFMNGCSPEPTCTEKAMAKWREENPKAGSAEASYRYSRFQQGCGEN